MPRPTAKPYIHPAPQPDALPLGSRSPWLAPLAGYTDLPFRRLCREYGAKCCVTEMVSAKGLDYGSRETWRVLETDEYDTPLVVQLFGSEPQFLGRSVARLKDMGFVWFDLNMGCSVPKVARQGAGSAMLKDPDNAIACARAMLKEAGEGHVTFKLRLGLTDQTINWLEVALRLEDEGAGLITLHPRTAKQGFGGTIRREEFLRAKEHLHIPVIASGDLFTAEDGIKCLDETGVDGIMYARGALTNPAVFADHLALAEGKPLPVHTRQDLQRMIRRHMELISLYGDEENALFRLRSIVPRYVRSFPGIRRLRQRLCQCQSFSELDEILAYFLDGEPSDALPDAAAGTVSDGSTPGS